MNTTAKTFTQDQIIQFERLCNQRCYIPWYGTAFRSNTDGMLQAVEVSHRTKSKSVTFVANISIEEDGTLKVRQIKGKDREEIFALEDFDKALLKLNEYLL